MSLKALPLLFLLPPLNLAVAILAGWLFLPKRPRLGRWVIGVSAVLLIGLATPMAAGSLLAALEQHLPLTPPAANPPQAIIILGAEVERSPVADTVGRLTLERVRGGAELYRRTHLPILVSGGVAHPGSPAVATLMARTLSEDFEVPVRWVENRSRDTWENAEFSAEILRREGITSVYVVTHAWHERRAVIAFRHTGLTITAVPPSMSLWPEGEARDFVPQAGQWQIAYYAFHEWIGCAWYALR